MNSDPLPSPPLSPAFAALSHDILQSLILTRLDAPSLASFSCASSELHALSADDQLWQKISAATWPSISHPLISTVISTFPSAHRSFFSDAFPLVHHHRHSPATSNSPETTELISAVDIYYRNSPVFSKVEKTETTAGWFNTSPFRVDLLGPKEFVATWIQQEDARIHELEQDLTLSWIVVDPVKKRAVNLSSWRAVGVQRHWLTGEIQVKYAVVMAGWEREYVKCEAVVTCGGEGVHVREVSMTMEDLEGKGVNGKESLEILKEAMERGERRKVGGKGKESKERYKEFLVRRREMKLELQRKDRVMDWVCIATGVNCFLAFCSYVVFGR